MYLTDEKTKHSSWVGSYQTRKWNDVTSIIYFEKVYGGKSLLKRIKLEGETPKDAAKREVSEETGFIVELSDEKPLAESRYEISVNNEKVKKTVWFFEMYVVKAFDSEPDDEIEEVALVDYETAENLLTHDEDKKILKYVFNR